MTPTLKSAIEVLTGDCFRCFVQFTGEGYLYIRRGYVTSLKPETYSALYKLGLTLDQYELWQDSDNLPPQFILPGNYNSHEKLIDIEFNRTDEGWWGKRLTHSPKLDREASGTLEDVWNTLTKEW